MKKIEDFEKSSNPIEKIVKINSSISFVIQYYSTIFYCHCRERKVINKSIIELIQVNFHGKNPHLSAWIKLLKSSLSLLKYKTVNFPIDSGIKIQEAANYFIPKENKRQINSAPDLSTVLDSLLLIRNKGFAHVTEISETSSKILLNNGFKEVALDLVKYLESFDQSKLLLSGLIPILQDEEENDILNFLDYSESIIKNVEIERRSVENYDDLASRTLYCYFPKSSTFIQTQPFIFYRDDYFYCYDGVDKKIPIYNDALSLKRASVKKFQNAFYALIEENIDLLNNIQLNVNLKNEKGVEHNLPDPGYEKFIGRKTTKERILKALDHKRTYLITISGIGGVGKSAIAIKMAKDIIDSESKRYSYIIWVSAKKTYLTTKGVEIETQVFSSLLQLLDIILKITRFDSYLEYSFSAKKETCLDILSLDTFLLIVDNFETIPNPAEFLEYFEEIGNQCPDSKLLLTTRHQLGYSEKIIDLKEFDSEEYEEFVLYLAKYKFKLKEIPKREIINKLYEYTGGLPLATEFIIGQLSENKSLQKIFDTIEKVPKDSILEFSYNESFAMLKVQEKRTLYVISLIESPNDSNVSFVSGLDEYETEEIVSKLKKLSFINEAIIDDEVKYSVLPLTRSFLNKKLELDSNLLNELQAKYQEYKLITSISEKNDEGYSDEISYRNKTSALLAKAAYASAAQNDFTKSEDYFQRALSYSSDESIVWLYWAKAELDFSNNLKDDYFSNALKYAPQKDKEKILISWGVALGNYRRHRDSIEKLSEVLNINKENRNVYHLLGKSYYEIARNLYKKQAYEEMRSNYRLSKNAFESSLYGDPISAFEKNHNTVSFYFLAKISNFLKDKDSAKEFVRKGLLLQPNNYRLLDFMEYI